MSNLEDLKIVRLVDPTLVPTKLIEQLHNSVYSPEEFYEKAETESLLFDGEIYKLNPLNHLYVLVDESNKIKGVLWCTINGQECTLELFSIEREYWNKGGALKFAFDSMNDIFPPLGINKYKVHTTKPGAYENIGFKKSPRITMELEVQDV